MSRNRCFSKSFIVENFLKEAGKNLLSQRFNCFLSAGQIDHLKKLSAKTSVNKSEYLRELIEKDRKTAS